MESSGSEGPAASAKVCIHCGRDCAARPRKRDTQGKYHCQECLDQRGKQPTAPAEALAEIEPIALSLEPAPPPVNEKARSRPCPVCGEPLARNAVLCVSCGYNARTGEKLPALSKKKEKRSRGAKCAKCGYSLRGLMSPQCPECGTVNALEDSKREYDRDTSQHVARQAYRQPILMFLGGITAICILLGVTQDYPGEAITGYFIQLGVQLPIGLLVYWLCGVMWLGFDAPLHLIALRLMGLYAVVDVIAMGIGTVAHLALIGALVACIFYVHLLSEMLEMELVDAVIVGLLTFLAKIFVWMIIAAQLYS